MTRRAGMAGALALLLAACGPVEADNVSNNRYEAPPVEVSLSMRNGECHAALNGERGDGDALFARASRVLEDFIRIHEQYGIVQEFPAVLILGAPEVPWRCVGGAIHQVQRAGYTRLLFGRAGGMPIFFDLPIDEPGFERAPGPTNRITFRGDGTMLWNSGLVSDQQIGENLQTMAAMRPPPDLEMLLAPQTRLDAVLALLIRLRAAGIRTSLDEYELGETGVRFVDLDRFADELK